MVFGLGLFFQWHILDIQKSLKENIISFHSAITQLKKKTLQYRWHLPQPPIPFPNYISPRSYCRPGFGVHGSTGVFVLLLFVWWRYKVHTVQYTNLNCTVWWPMGSPPRSSHRPLLAFGFSILALHTNGIILCVLFCIWCFHSTCACEIYPCSCQWFTPIHCCIVVHCLNRPQFINHSTVHGDVYYFQFPVYWIVLLWTFLYIPFGRHKNAVLLVYVQEWGCWMMEYAHV